MKNNNLIDAFKAFEISDLTKVIGGIRYAATGGGTKADGSSYVDYTVQNDDRTPTGAYKCGIADGTHPGAVGGTGAGSGSGSGSGGTGSGGN